MIDVVNVRSGAPGETKPAKHVSGARVLESLALLVVLDPWADLEQYWAAAKIMTEVILEPVPALQAAVDSQALCGIQ